MPSLYADSFGGLTQAQLAFENQRRQAFAGAMSNFMQAMKSQQQQGNFEQQFAFQKKEAEDASKERMAAAKDRRQRILDEELSASDRNRISQGYLDIYKNQADAGGTPAQIRDREFAFNAAGKDADTGLFDSPPHVKQLYQTLSDPEAQLMAQRSASVRPQIAAAHEQATRAAGLLNAYEDLKKQIPPNTPDANTLAETAKGGMFTRKSTAAAAADMLAKVQKRDAIAPVATRLRTSPLVSIDPDSGSWVPNVPPPRWIKPPQSGDYGGEAGPAAPTGARNLGPAMAPAPSAGTPTTQLTPANGGRHSAWLYNRVNELIGMGMDPVSAKTRALKEEAVL